MKVVAFNGSPRKDGNTSLLIDHVLAEVAGDEEGLRIMKVLGENMAWLLGRIHGE